MEEKEDFKMESALFLRVADQLRELYKKLAYDNVSIADGKVSYLREALRAKMEELTALKNTITTNFPKEWYRCLRCGELFPYKAIVRPNVRTRKKPPLCNECYKTTLEIQLESED